MVRENKVIGSSVDFSGSLQMGVVLNSGKIGGQMDLF